MNLNDYFNPVELDKPEDYFLDHHSLFGKNIRIHTLNSAIDEISNYQVALIGVPEDRNSLNKGSSQAPDKIRVKLYQLFRINEKVKIIDLGNLKIGENTTDTYYALRDVVLDLLNNQVVSVIIGGTQDLTLGCFLGFELYKNNITLVTIDSTIDFNNSSSASDNYLSHILNKQNKLFSYKNLGHQKYLTPGDILEELEKQLHEAIRLGNLKNNLQLAEPVLRDADLVSIDIGAVKQGDAPARIHASPNGFHSDEICQLARYAGLSDRASVFGIFEINSSLDINSQTHHLAAQMIWYFIDGFTHRKIETPGSKSKDFKVFIVNHEDMKHDITFIKSLKTERWWMEIPVVNTGSSLYISSSLEDYQQACDHEIPDLWWKLFQKIN